MISGADTELVSEIFDRSIPFDEATKKILGTEYIIGSLVIPQVIVIESALKNSNPQHVLRVVQSHTSKALKTGVQKYYKPSAMPCFTLKSSHNTGRPLIDRNVA
ncbi:hypothetical protein AVEN_114265-1 [Araneus ventricosus]|uniref:Uncharacterized protein n=1 Tax=Araneus ventricosus TaxID=182803 RepID=A0A4Y2MF24_ARAVE|nr:hypothetical protein AVEN_114265-1 [Araneus ventricosus]